MSLLHSHRSRRRRQWRSPRPVLPIRDDPVTVSVMDTAATVANLTPLLPEGWTVRRITELGATDIDLLVLGGATGAAVGGARRSHPYSMIVAVIDHDAAADVIVDVLGAGADACVRSGSVAILAGHVRACHRRRLAGYP